LKLTWKLHGLKAFKRMKVCFGLNAINRTLPREGYFGFKKA